jgi:hypothetical protein
MAVFNPPISVNLGGDFVNRSQGQTPNRALGELFSGLAGVVTDYSKQKKQAEAKALTTAVQGSVDRLDQQAVPDTPASIFSPQQDASGASEGHPGLVSAQDRLGRLAQAKKTGVMSDLEYATKVAAEAKRLRVLFPDQTDKIDDMFANAVGTSTSNAMRRELLQSIASEDRVRAKEQSDRQDLLKSFPDILGSADLQKSYKDATGQDFNPDNFNMNGLLYVKGRVEKEKSDIQLAQGRANLAETGSKQRADAFYVAGIKQAATLRDRIIGDTFNSKEAVPGTNFKFSDINQTINKYAADGFSPDEITAINQQINQAETVLKQVADQMIDGVDKDGNSLRAEIKDPKKLDEIRDTILGPLNIVKESFAGKNADLSTLNIIKIDQQARKDAGENAFLKANGGTLLNNLKAFRDNFPEAASAYNQILVKRLNNQPLSPEESATAAKIGMYLDGKSSLHDLLLKYEEDFSQNKAGVSAGINSWAQTLTSPQVPKEEAAKLANSVFSASEHDLLEKFGEKNPQALFDTLVSPEMTNKLKDTEVFDKYSAWSFAQARAIMKPYRDQMADAQSGLRSMDIAYDEKTHRFVVTPNAAGAVTDSLLNPLFSKYGLYKGKTAVDGLNTYLNRIQPILDANKISVETFLELTFTGQPYKDIQKQGSTLEVISKKFFNFLQSNAPPQENLKGKGLPPMDKDTQDYLWGPQGALDGSSKDAVVYANQRAIRNHPLTASLEAKMGHAVAAVFGAGYKAQVFSGGQEGERRTGTRRHNHGKAGDVYIIGPDGKKVRDKEKLNRLKTFWLDSGYGSVGTFMGDYGMHLDEHTKDELRRGEALTWNY